MTLQDTKAFNRAFNGLAELYNLNGYEDRRTKYFQALSDLAIASVEGACTEAAKRAGVGPCRFFPLPGTLREFTTVARRSNSPYIHPTRPDETPALIERGDLSGGSLLASGDTRVADEHDCVKVLHTCLVMQYCFAPC